MSHERVRVRVSRVAIHRLVKQHVSSTTPTTETTILSAARIVTLAGFVNTDFNSVSTIALPFDGIHSSSSRSRCRQLFAHTGNELLSMYSRFLESMGNFMGLSILKTTFSEPGEGSTRG